MRKKTYTKVKLKIADIIILMQSGYPLFEHHGKEEAARDDERFKNFLYLGNKKADIVITINMVDKLPEIKQAKNVFITYHPDDNNENWRLQKKGKTYVYRAPLEDKQQLMLVNKAFDRVTAYLIPQKDKGYSWGCTDIIYDFLQVLLINYFALNKIGVFVHSVGIKDTDGRGLLFAGKSEAGKSTTARIWHKFSKATVLNDDRIIVRRLKGKFTIYGSPWHGDFSDYLTSEIASVPLDKVFFIYHAAGNKFKDVLRKNIFNLLYPTLFPAFWDKSFLENVVTFCQGLIKVTPCYRLGFVNDDKIIDFVRKIPYHR